MRKIAVIGQGYVGLMIAVAFGKLNKVIAFDINPKRINELKKNLDRFHEVSKKEIELADIFFTTDAKQLKKADFHIISVPTPIDSSKNPDFTMLIKASEIVGEQLKKGDIVVYESTVYPGVTEEKCIPVLERVSGRKCGKDFAVGYSPERINPGDKIHTFKNIPKIIAGMNSKTSSIIKKVYQDVLAEKVYTVSSIKAAEALKIIENTQRDINIAFMNEMAMFLHALKLDTHEIIRAMKTKWNYIPFQPGLVGGHCIGVNSYYLLSKADEIGCSLDLTSTGRRINESMAQFIVERTIKKMITLNINIKKARVAILGLTYKENCRDIRDTRVLEIIKNFQSYGIQILIHDPIANSSAAQKEYGIKLTAWQHLKNIDVIILLVAHQFYIDLDIKKLIKKINTPGLIMDIKEIFNPEDFAHTKIVLWRL